MATASTIFSFKIAPNPSPVSSFKEKTMTMNPSLSWDSAKTKILSCLLLSHVMIANTILAEIAYMGCSYFDELEFYFLNAYHVNWLSFRTTEESLRNAFQNFGQLVDVNLVMDKVAKRPRGFAFLRYETEEEAQKAIEGMHGKEDSFRTPTMLKTVLPVKLVVLAEY
ncbi:hypothetical protein POTOM_042839 [Populus tomentosa]|uniref:RRM domain-containing protein n=1 Tax=Populus tomentosa TaxID=118781 RepID=A0A8X7YL17_POPTO|nr:hypothetical protein POTOM_042839 [Populus tomentosa]